MLHRSAPAAVHCVRRENDGQGLLSLRRLDVIQPGKLGLQDLLGEERQGALRLVACRCKKRAPRQGELEAPRPPARLFHESTACCEKDEAPHPGYVGLPRAYAIVLSPEPRHWLETPFRRTVWPCAATALMFCTAGTTWRRRPGRSAMLSKIEQRNEIALTDLTCLHFASPSPPPGGSPGCRKALPAGCSAS